MNAPAACLFDLDGLLLDTEPCQARAWREAARNFGLELTERQLLALRGRRRLDNVEQVCRWIEASGRNVPDGQTLMAVQQPIARRLLPEALAMPGAPQLLERCHELAVATALVTSSSRESLAIKTAGHPWLEQIDLRVLGDDPQLEAGKPAPDPFLLAAQRLGVNPGDCWAFEDSPAGALSAEAAGCRVHVLLPPGLGVEERDRLYPGDCSFLDSLHEVPLS